MVAAGSTVEQCLEAFPHYARELRSALVITEALQTEAAQPAPARPAQSVAAQRQSFVGAVKAARRTARQQPGVSWLDALTGLFRQPAWARLTALLLIVLSLLGFGRVAVTAAAGALPGDTLYPVKLAAEQARLWVTPDVQQRALLRQQFEQNRREEVDVVVEQRRQVQVQFPGVIESMVDGHWRIVGLEMPLLVPGDAVVRGQPAVGARVVILAYSDGSGSLVARQVLVLAPAEETPPTPTVTPTRTPLPTQPVFATLQPSATWTPTPESSATWTPTASATYTPTPTATETATPTPSGTPTATPSPTATPTATFPPRPRPIFGPIVEKQPTWWQVGQYGIIITPDTVIDESQGPAVVGAPVHVEAFEYADGSLVADKIQVQPSIETDFFTGVIREMGGPEWFIGNRWVVVDGSTEIIGVPEVGNSASVEVWRVMGGPWIARRIAVDVPVPDEPFYIADVIEEINASFWVVQGVNILITDETTFSGLPPQVGLWAEVTGVRRNGSAWALTMSQRPP